MKISDCFADPRVVDGSMWCRPADWPLNTYAVRDGTVVSVPSHRGGNPILHFTVEQLAADWEVVEPGAALAEQHSILRGADLCPESESAEGHKVSCRPYMREGGQ